MVEFSFDERGATSVVGLMLLLAVTIIVAPTVAVFVFNVDTDDVTEAAEDILDMDDDIHVDENIDENNSLVPLLVVPVSRFGASRRTGGKPQSDESTSRPAS